MSVGQDGENEKNGLYVKPAKGGNLGVEIDEKHDVRCDSKVKLRYVIFSQQRVGSNLLCAELSNSGVAGVPGEYLHQMVIDNFLSRRSMNQSENKKVSLEQYLRGVESFRTTSNGVFGIKIQPYQISGVAGKDNNKIIKSFERYDAIIFMTRRQKLKQAISGVIGTLTNKWRNDGEEHNLPEIPDDKIVEMISQKLFTYIHEENQMKALLRKIKKPMINIVYEEYIANRSKTLAKLYDFIGVDAGGNTNEFVALPKKPPSTQADRYYSLFMSGITD